MGLSEIRTPIGACGSVAFKSNPFPTIVKAAAAAAAEYPL